METSMKKIPSLLAACVSAVVLAAGALPAPGAFDEVLSCASAVWKAVLRGGESAPGAAATPVMDAAMAPSVIETLPGTGSDCVPA